MPESCNSPLAAVWKNSIIRTKGDDGVEDLCVGDVKASLRAVCGAQITIQAEETVDSTNLRLKEWSRQGRIRAPYLLCAGCQTAGRGRLGRAFVSPPDTGLYMSLLSGAQGDPGRITVLAAVAVCRAIEETTPLKPKIKWVNDLFVRGKKVCGILAEKVDAGVIIGIGVNVRTPPGGFPPEAGVAGALDADVSRSRLAGRIAGYLLRGLAHLRDPAILDAYRQRMPLIGREISYARQGQTKNARVTGVSDDGGLMIDGPDGPDVLRSGEISLGSQSFAGLE